MLGFGAFVGGLVLLGIVVLCAAYAGAVALRRLPPDLRGLDRVLAWTVLTTTALIAEHVLPLALGILSRWTVLAASLALAACAWALGMRGRVPRVRPEG